MNHLIGRYIVDVLIGAIVPGGPPIVEIVTHINNGFKPGSAGKKKINVTPEMTKRLGRGIVFNHYGSVPTLSLRGERIVKVTQEINLNDTSVRVTIITSKGIAYSFDWNTTVSLGSWG